jgi:hypothetical protein
MAGLQVLQGWQGPSIFFDKTGQKIWWYAFYMSILQPFEMIVIQTNAMDLFNLILTGLRYAPLGLLTMCTVFLIYLQVREARAGLRVRGGR